jgi:arsenate reductase-like glutaredoxin family protein
MTVCAGHVRAVRAWLRTRMHPYDEIDTYSTDLVMREWDNISALMEDTPVLRLTRSVA